MARTPVSHFFFFCHRPFFSCPFPFLFLGLVALAADSFPFSDDAEIEQANEKRASEVARLGWTKKLGRSRLTPSPTALFCHSFAVFLPFASVWKRKGNGCYAGYRYLFRFTFFLAAVKGWMLIMGKRGTNSFPGSLLCLPWSLERPRERGWAWKWTSISCKYNGPFQSATSECGRYPKNSLLCG